MKVKVDLCAIVQNCRVVRQQLKGAKMCAVVKNNAYGHGIEQVSRAIVPYVDMFAVGSVDEANKIACLSKPVLILLPLFERELKLAVEKGYVLTVDSMETLQRVASCDGSKKVHFKFNTGMNRLGFDCEQIEDIYKIVSQSNVEVQGVFSHFANCDFDSCNKQLSNFSKISSRCKELFGENTVCHVANSNAVFLHQKFHLDMARVGLALYGYGNEQLVPAKSVTAKVIATRELEKGQPIGYDGIFVAPKRCKIAVIDVGYANGLPRVLTGSNVLVGKKLCKIVGNICMGMCFLDVSGCNVAVGDEVFLLGKGLNLANNDVSAYELLCNFANCCKI